MDLWENQEPRVKILIIPITNKSGHLAHFEKQYNLDLQSVIYLLCLILFQIMQYSLLMNLGEKKIELINDYFKKKAGFKRFPFWFCCS